MTILIRIRKLNNRAMAQAAISIMRQSRSRELTESEIKTNPVYMVGHSFLETELKKFPLSWLKTILRPKLNRVIEHKTILARMLEKEGAKEI